MVVQETNQISSSALLATWLSNQVVEVGWLGGEAGVRLVVSSSCRVLPSTSLQPWDDIAAGAAVRRIGKLAIID